MFIPQPACLREWVATPLFQPAAAAAAWAFLSLSLGCRVLTLCLKGNPNNNNNNGASSRPSTCYVSCGSAGIDDRGFLFVPR